MFICKNNVNKLLENKKTFIKIYAGHLYTNN